MLAALGVHAGDASRFASYLKHVPREFQSLSHWTSDELRELQDSDLISEVCLLKHTISMSPDDGDCQAAWTA